MERRSLGRSGIEVSRLGLGAVTFGREIGEAESFAIMDHAFEQGINVFDTAEAYGGGASEIIIGRWLRATGVRNQIVLVSKVTTNFSREHVRTAIEASLDRLQTDHLDFYLFHSFDRNTPQETAVMAMDGVQKSGLTRSTGCSNFTGPQVREAVKLAARLGIPRLEVVEGICNLAVRDAETDLLPLCRDKEIGFLSYSPLGAGFLTGKYSPNRKDIPSGSRFDVIPGHADIYFTERNFQIAEQLQADAAQQNIPVAQLAIAWVLGHQDVTSALLGARNTSHIDTAISALHLHESRK
jgi:aryl-alcohol dehydrogenase-like predicted oxidoreductase